MSNKRDTKPVIPRFIATIAGYYINKEEFDRTKRLDRITAVIVDCDSGCWIEHEELWVPAEDSDKAIGEFIQSFHEVIIPSAVGDEPCHVEVLAGAEKLERCMHCECGNHLTAYYSKIDLVNRYGLDLEEESPRDRD